MEECLSRMEQRLDSMARLPELFLDTSTKLQKLKQRWDLMSLRQEGSVAEFNHVFDSLSANLDVPEDYLVDAYVHALKQEIGHSVRFFRPRSMHQAKLFARTEETFLRWRAQKAEEQLKQIPPDLPEDKCKNLINIVAEREEKLELPVSVQETKSDDEVRITYDVDKKNKNAKMDSGEIGLSMQGFSRETEENRDSKSGSINLGFSTHTLAVDFCNPDSSLLVLGIPPLPPQVSVILASTPISDKQSSSKKVSLRSGPLGLVSNEMKHIRETKVNLECAIVSDFRTLESGRNTKTVLGVYGSLDSVSQGGLQGLLHVGESWQNAKITLESGGSSTIKDRSKFSVKPNNIVPIISSIPPLSLFFIYVLPLGIVKTTSFIQGSSIFDFSGRFQALFYCIDRCEDGKQTLGDSGVQFVTWGDYFFPAYSVSGTVDSAASTLSLYTGLQLSNIFSFRHKSFDSILDFLGFAFEGNGPCSLLQWVTNIKPTNVSLIWVLPINFSPTIILLKIWFKGELLWMLIGRFCSLSRKEKK